MPALTQASMVVGLDFQHWQLLQAVGFLQPAIHAEAERAVVTEPIQFGATQVARTGDRWMIQLGNQHHFVDEGQATFQGLRAHGTIAQGQV